MAGLDDEVLRLRAENEALRNDTEFRAVRAERDAATAEAVKLRAALAAAEKERFTATSRVNELLRDLAAAERERDEAKAEIKELTSGSRNVRCPSCHHVIDLDGSLPEVTYDGDIEEVECSQCGCEFEAHAEAVTVVFMGVIQ